MSYLLFLIRTAALKLLALAAFTVLFFVNDIHLMSIFTGLLVGAGVLWVADGIDHGIIALRERK
ncbi:MAG: hypothetical protein F4W90_03720 [Gammaproteobacteria bacterium]|nr:hypothetical protein [Gammaproteobacteria bacterium]